MIRHGRAGHMGVILGASRHHPLPSTSPSRCAAACKLLRPSLAGPVTSISTFQRSPCVCTIPNPRVGGGLGWKQKSAPSHGWSLFASRGAGFLYRPLSSVATCSRRCSRPPNHGRRGRSPLPYGLAGLVREKSCSASMPSTTSRTLSPTEQAISSSVVGLSS